MENCESGSCSLASFRAASMQFDAAYARFAKLCGLSETEYWSLLLVSEGASTQREICGKLSASPQTLNSAFKQLVGKGLVRLEPLEHDQRTKQIILTQAGSQFVEQNVAKMHRLEEQAWQALSPEEQESLTDLTRRFGALITASLDQEAN